MVVGESIRPNSDTTMRTMREDITKSINPIDYYGQSFSYQKWLEDKTKEYYQKQQHELDMAKSSFENEKSGLEAKKSNVVKESELYLNSPEYKEFLSKQTAAKEEYLKTYAPSMGGSYKFTDFAIDKYKRDMFAAKAEVDNQYKAIKSSTNKSEYNTAKEKYDAAVDNLKSIITNKAPTTEEGKKIYKDEIKEGVKQGPTYASGWGVGGYHGFGDSSIGVRDALESQVTGGKVGQVKISKTLTPTQAMQILGYTLMEDKDTGTMGYFKYENVLDEDGKTVLDKQNNPVQRLQKFAGVIPGLDRTAPMRQFVQSGSSEVLAGMKFTGRPTDEQISESVAARMEKGTIAQSNILEGLATRYKMATTPGAQKEASENYNNYVSKITSVADINSRFQSAIGDIKDASGMAPKPELLKEPSIESKVGEIMGTNIYKDKSGQDFVSIQGQSIPLSAVVAWRDIASKKGEYGTFNTPGLGAGGNMPAISNEYQQLLNATFGKNVTDESTSLMKVGSTIVDGKSLDVVQYNGREWVRPNTGPLVPLSDMNELNKLATKTGEFRYNSDLYDQEMDVIKSYKMFGTSLTQQDKDRYSNKFSTAIQNIKSNPSFTIERATTLDSILKSVPMYAGMKIGSSGSLEPEDNIAKSMLLYTTRSPVENVVSAGILSKDFVDKYPVIKDIVKKMPKYGDPVVGSMRIGSMGERDFDTLSKIAYLDPKSSDYDQMTDIVAKSASRGETFGLSDKILDRAWIMNMAPENINEVSESQHYGVASDIRNRFILGNQSQAISPPSQQQSAPATARVADTSTMKINLKIDNTMQLPTRGGLNSALIKTGALSNTFKGKGGISIKSVLGIERKAKKSTPKVDSKSKKSDKIMKFEIPSMGKIQGNLSGISEISNNLSKFTIGGKNKKKKDKKKK